MLRPLTMEEQREFVKAMFQDELSANTSAYDKMSVDELIKQVELGDYAALIQLYVAEKRNTLPNEKSKHVIQLMTMRAIDSAQYNDDKLLKRALWQSRKLKI